MAAPRKENIKEIIIDTTERLLDTYRTNEVTLALIAKEANISKGTLYYYYKSKNDIYFDIADKYLGQQLEDLVNWSSNKNKDTSLHRLIKYILERDIDTAKIRMHLFYDSMLGNEEIREKLLLRYREFATIINEKITERTNLDADYLTWLILLCSDGLFIHKMMNNDDVDIEQFIIKTEKYANMFIKDKKNDK